MSLSALLDDLADSAAPPPSRSDLLWRRGRRRRAARRVQTGVLLAAAVGVLALLLPSAGVEVPVVTPARGEQTGARIDSRPEQIGPQWLIPDLPDRPGPMVALLSAVDVSETATESDGWYAVRPDGLRYRLPEVGHEIDAYPALSDDGRLLGYLEGPEGPFVVRDLVTGEVTAFGDVGRDVLPRPRRHAVSGQSPSSFSPDGRHLLLAGGVGVLLDLEAGTIRPTGRGPASTERPGLPAGWSADDRIVWLDADVDQATGDARRVQVITTDLDGKVVGTTALRPDRGPLGRVDQWSGLARPGRDLLLLVDGDGDGDLTSDGLRRFSPTTGAESASVVDLPEVATACGPAWAVEPVVPVTSGEPPLQALTALHTTSERGRAWTTVDASIGGRCLLWAADGVAAPGQEPPPLLGPARSVLVLRPRPVLAGGLVLVVWLAVVVGALRVRRRSRF